MLGFFSFPLSSQPQHLSRHRSLNFYTILKAVIVLSLISIYLLVSYRLSPVNAPDEPMRLLVPFFIVDNGCLPLGSDPAIVNTTWGTSYGFSAYGSSLLAVPFMLVAKLIHDTPFCLLFAARFSVVITSGLNLVLCMKLADAFKMSRSAGLTVVLMVGLLPQYVFLSSYFNSDILGIAATALCVLQLKNAHDSRWDNKRSVYLGLALGVAALSYYYAYGIFIVAIFVYVCDCVFGYVQNNRSLAYRIVGIPFLIIVSALVVCGWFFVRNIVLYNGDIFGMSTSSSFAELHAAEGFVPSTKTTPARLGFSPLGMLVGELFGMNWTEYTSKSALCYLGAMQYGVADVFYNIYIFFFVLA